MGRQALAESTSGALVTAVGSLGYGSVDAGSTALLWEHLRWRMLRQVVITLWPMAQDKRFNNWRRKCSYMEVTFGRLSTAGYQVAVGYAVLRNNCD